MKREEIVKVLTEIRASKERLAKVFEDEGDQFQYTQYHSEAYGIDTAILMLTRDSFSRTMKEIYVTGSEVEEDDAD